MQVIYSFHMPLLFIISGYFLNFNTSIKDFVNSKFRRLIIPYCFCCGILTILKAIIAAVKQENIGAEFMKWLYISIYGSGSGTGTPYITAEGIKYTSEIGMLWFLLALFCGSIIVRIVYGRKFDKLIIVAVSAIGIISSKIIWLPFSIQNGMAVCFWIYIGAAVKKHDLLNSIYKIKKIWLLPVGILWCVSILFGRTYLYSNYYKLWLIDIAGALSGCIFILLISKFISQRSAILGKFLSWAGMNTMAFYAIHFWEEKVKRVNDILSGLNIGVFENNIVVLIVGTIIVVLICTIGTLLFEKIAVTRNIFGIKKLKY